MVGVVYRTEEDVITFLHPILSFTPISNEKMPSPISHPLEALSTEGE